MRQIDAASVADELIKIFSRVGVPQEILTDQGSNFTSQLLAELYRMLHVKPIRTTPYHPQTDGLVERFNQTLKLMLRKTTAKEGKDWDRLLPFLLFAYREVPQASTGFSPFELLYGHQVRGPLDILSESWQSDEKSDESITLQSGEEGRTGKLPNRDATSQKEATDFPREPAEEVGVARGVELGDV